jgi:hypothetical protein
MAKKREPTGRTAPPGAGDPEVLLDIEYDRGCLFLVLANVGPATAFDVRVTFEKPLLGAGGCVDVTALGAFGLTPILRPGKEIRVFVDVARELLGRRGSKQVRAHVTYQTRARTRLGEVFAHDLRIWRDWPEVRFGGKGT